jgi:hypothetical protein
MVRIYANRRVAAMKNTERIGDRSDKRIVREAMRQDILLVKPTVP